MAHGEEAMILWALRAFAAMTCVTWAVYRFDKWCGQWHYWRVPERVLQRLALCGGLVGALLGMYTYGRGQGHKTAAASWGFRAGLRPIIAGYTVVVAAVTLLLLLDPPARLPFIAVGRTLWHAPTTIPALIGGVAGIAFGYVMRPNRQRSLFGSVLFGVIVGYLAALWWPGQFTWSALWRPGLFTWPALWDGHLALALASGPLIAAYTRISCLLIGSLLGFRLLTDWVQPSLHRVMRAYTARRRGVPYSPPPGWQVQATSQRGAAPYAAAARSTGPGLVGWVVLCVLCPYLGLPLLLIAKVRVIRWMVGLLAMVAAGYGAALLWLVGAAQVLPLPSVATTIIPAIRHLPPATLRADATIQALVAAPAQHVAVLRLSVGAAIICTVIALALLGRGARALRRARRARHAAVARRQLAARSRHGGPDPGDGTIIPLHRS